MSKPSTPIVLSVADWVPSQVRYMHVLVEIRLVNALCDDQELKSLIYFILF